MKRVRTQILVEIDLDPVPGWGNDPQDYVNHIQQMLKQSIPHYHPEVKVFSTFDNTEHIHVYERVLGDTHIERCPCGREFQLVEGRWTLIVEGSPGREWPFSTPPTEDRVLPARETATSGP